MRSPISLRSYLYLHFAVGAALPIIIIGILVWFFLMPNMRINTGVQFQAMARSIAGQVSAHLMGGERQLTALAEYLETRQFTSQQEMVELLDAQCGKGEFFETIYIASKEDVTIKSVGLAESRRAEGDDMMGLDLSGRRYIHTAMGSKKVVWSETFLSTISSRMAVALTISSADNFIIGEIALDNLSEFISHLPVESEFLTLVIDRQGRIVADSQQLRWGQQLTLPTLSSNESNGGQRFTFSSIELDGKRFFAAVVEVEELGWTVLLGQPVRKTLESLNEMFVMLGFGAVVALFLALFISLFQAGKLSRLFNSYAEKAQSVARGQYDLQWPLAVTHEFIHLGQSLEEMAQQISQREKALSESQNYLQITLDSIGDAVIATDSQGMVTSMNPMAEKLTGWQANNAINEPLTEVFRIVNSLTRKPVQNPVDEVLAKGEIIGLANHTLLISKDGHEHQIADSGAPIRQTDGQIVGVVLVFRDVTESYAQQQRIRENEKRLQDIVANVPGMVFQCTADPHQFRANRFISVVPEKMTEVFSLTSRPESFFEDFIACLPEEDQARFITVAQEAIEGNKPWHYEGQFIKPSGDRIWISSDAAPQKAGNRLVFYGVMMDITERKQSEEEVRRLRNYLSNVINSMPSILVGVDGDSRVTQWNRRAEIVTGIHFEQAVSQSLFEVFPGLENEMAPINKAINQRKTIRKLKIPRQVNGNTLFEDITIFPLVTNGVEGAVIRVDDVTERVRIEEMMVQSEKMLSVGGLAAGMAHEINNPLAGMLQTAEVMANRLEMNNQIPANQRAAEAAGTTMECIEKYMTARGIPRMVNTISDSGQRIAAIVNNMLSFARKSAATGSSYNLEDILDKTLELAAADYDLKKHYDFKLIQIIKEYRGNLPSVPCESVKIQQVLLNIFRNGSEAMHAAGVQTPKFIIRTLVDTERDMVIVEIEDNGPGMDEATQKRVFEPFFTTKPLGEGTGLGLSVSYFIITENHHGKLKVDSRPGYGSIFTIALPMEGKS